MPCEVRAERDPLAVLHLVQYSGPSINPAPDGRSLLEWYYDAVRQLAERYQDVSSMGLARFSVTRSTVEQRCGQLYELSVPPAEHHRDAIARALAAWDPRPIGASPLALALERAFADLASAAPPGRRMVLLYTDGSSNDCDGSVSEAQCLCPLGPVTMCFDERGRSYACLDTDRVATRIEQGARDGQQVVVLGYFPHPRPGVVDQVAVLGHWAQSAGIVNAGGVYPFWRVNDAGELARMQSEVLDREVHCARRIAAPGLLAGMTWTLFDDREATVPQDPTHREGWDWSDAEHLRLRLYGSACTRAAQTRASLRFGSGEARCFDPLP